MELGDGGGGANLVSDEGIGKVNVSLAAHNTCSKSSP